MKGLWSEHFPTAEKPPESPSPSKTYGLWSEIFPASDKTPPPPPSPPPLGPCKRCFICPTCNVSCRLFTSSTPQNPGRQFYTCPSHDHKFFKWADEVKPEDFIDVPHCGGCTAGVCRVRREKSGSNAGRILFMCRVKEGEGSCGYRVWKDDLEISAMTQADERTSSFQSTTSNNNDIGPTNIDMVDESKPSDEVADSESPVIDNSSHLQCLGVTPGEMEVLKSDKLSASSTSRRSNKRSRNGDLTAPASLISSHFLTICLAKNSESIGHCWMAAAVRQNLSTQLQGWWGRLAFHPTPFLRAHASKPFTYHVSSLLDSTFAIDDDTLVNSCDSIITLTRSLPRAESSSKPLFNPDQDAELSGIKPFHLTFDDMPSCINSFRETKMDNVMSKSISKAFTEAAEHLRNDLLTLLEPMDVKDHQAMSQAAQATFTALDRLLFDHQGFKNCTKEFIRCAASLAEIEQSMPRNDSFQKLVDHCSSERMRLDEINCAHAKVVDTVTNSKKRLIDLQEEISSTMDWIFQMEAEVACCEVEMRHMERELENITEKKEVLEGNYVIASKELELSQKLREEKEVERDAAKVAFDRARALLRGQSCN